MSGGFDIKELIYRNYHRILAPQDHLTLLVIRREDAKGQAPLTAHVFGPNTSPTSPPSCSLALGYNDTSPVRSPVPYPGLPGYTVSFIDFYLDKQCGGRSGESGIWRVVLEENKEATFYVGPEELVWQPVEVCGEACAVKCATRVWSTEWMDRKTTLGHFNAASGQLLFGSDDGEGDTTPLSIPI